jgi:hypothetical protein
MNLDWLFWFFLILFFYILICWRLSFVFSILFYTELSRYYLIFILLLNIERLYFCNIEKHLSLS